MLTKPQAGQHATKWKLYLFAYGTRREWHVRRPLRDISVREIGIVTSFAKHLDDQGYLL